MMGAVQQPAGEEATMYRTVLVPLDGSPGAERALPIARAIVRRTGGRLVLVHYAPADPSPLQDLPVAQVEAVAEAGAYLQRVAGPAPAGLPFRWWRGAARAGGGGTETETGVADGPGAKGLLAEAARRRADAIVMTTPGPAGQGGWLAGSVAAEVLRRAEVPVLLVPAAGAGAPAAGRGGAPLRVLVPLDGSPAAEAVLAALRPLAAATSVRALLLRVVEPRRRWHAGPGFGVPPAADPTAELAAARRYLEAVAAALRPAVAAVAVQATVGYPEDEIAARARTGDVDLVAMATRGPTGFAQAGLGSVATLAVQLAAVPLLLVRPGGRPRTAAAAPPAWPPATVTCSGAALVGSAT
jgi:nucleotide-binding universal stress UspA family protein